MRVNDYNPILLLLWKANLDVQFVSENSLALAHYVTGYVTKAEKSHMHEIWDEISSKESLYSKLWSFGVRSLRSRECGLYEASDILLGDHLYEKSQTVQWICADQPHKRKRRLRNHGKLKELLENDPNSLNIFDNNIIDDFYPARPNELEEICLYDFIKHYTYCGTDSSGNRKYRKLIKPRLPNHRLYDPTKENERESYYYSLLLLFVPFRNESDLIGEHGSAEQTFNSFLAPSNDMKGHHEKLLKMLQAQTKIHEINEHRETVEHVKKDDGNEPEGLQITGEAVAAMNDVHDMDANKANNFNLHERIEMLNSDQLHVFKMVSEHFHRQQQHKIGVCVCKDFKPLHTFISGVGGTGKSFLIETIRQQVSEIWKDDTVLDTKCAVRAPTGLASYNIRGLTVHHMFLLPIEHKGKTAGYWRLSKDTQKVMRTNLNSLKLVIIDEVSMLSNLNLAYIHLRLEELFGGTEWFGSINVMFVGDLLQLPPVNGDPVFCKLNSKAVSKLGCMGSGNIWKHTVTYDELTINERQKKDPVYSKILDEVHRGSPSQDSLKCLRERTITLSVVEKYKQLCESGSHPVCLFPTCKQCQDHNSNMLSVLGTKLETFACVDEIDETSSTRKWNKKATDALSKANKDCNMTAGLEAKLELAVGARVMLRRNINTKDGLVNGSIGSVTAITPHCVTVKFDHIPEPYPIQRVKSKFMLMKTFYVYRKQFPLILAYAVTIHKCQRLSLDSAIIDLSSKVFSPGMAYVALSRVRSLSGLHLTHFDPASIIVSNSCLEEINRLRSIYRKDLPLYNIPKNKSSSRKRKFAVKLDEEPPPAKKPCIEKQKPKRKLSLQKESTKSNPPKKSKRDTDTDCVYTGTESGTQHTTWPDLRFFPVNEDWQRQACNILGLEFRGAFNHGHDRGGPDTILTRPDCRSLKRIVGDGNCLFRSLCYIITGSEEQHFALRTAIVQHMLSIPYMFVGYGTDGQPNCVSLFCHPHHYESVEEYVRQTRMDFDRVWGTNVEMACLAHILRAPVYCYDASQRYHIWAAYFPNSVDRSIPRDVQHRPLYILC